MKAISLGAFSALTLLALTACSGGDTDNGTITLIDGSNGLDNFNVVGDANWAAGDGAIEATADRKSVV